MRKLVQSDMELPINSERMKKTKILLQIKRNKNIVVPLLSERKHPDKHQEDMVAYYRRTGQDERADQAIYDLDQAEMSTPGYADE